MKRFNEKAALLLLILLNCKILFAQIDYSPGIIKANNVQTVIDIMYRFDLEGKDSVFDTETKTNFDRDGLKTDRISKDFRGLEYKWLYDKGIIILAQIFIKGKIYIETSYEYDEKGREVKQKKIITGGEPERKDTSVTVIEYDEKGFKTSALTYSKNNVLSSKTLFSYDENGNLSEEIEYNADGSIHSEAYYEYDRFNRKTNYKFSFENFFSNYRFIYSYEGDLIEKIFCDKNGLALSHEIYLYDDKGKVTKAYLLDRNGKKEYHWIYEYSYYEN
jgi:hypothetical protein